MDIYDLMPQVKQVIKEEEEDKVEELFENIKKEMKRRKKKFQGVILSNIKIRAKELRIRAMKIKEMLEKKITFH